MKKQITLIVFLFSITIYAQEQLKINTNKSEIKWSDEYSFYFGGHNGKINVSKGYFIKSKDVISGGEFIIDMTSITCDDLDDEEANKSLVAHLKNEDFFAVDRFPTAKLVISRVEYHDNTSMKIYANLTIKDITLPIAFQAKVNYETQLMTTKFKIDRQRWGIDYNSKLRDGAIADGIGFEITLSL
ncbi:YceI family protein [Winogradskyella sp. PG-2]|uniref:YceI family protein n=1 Tax=Winogradskyella sp. PG-2 TaxID=754409 RepID=UPI0004587A68|nr:YceI family protein [Winogradskyella sp. PG-2]BAO77312.1 rhodanese-like domain protein [Winogradskyella sp. PG-2]